MVYANAAADLAGKSFSYFPTPRMDASFTPWDYRVSCVRSNLDGWDESGFDSIRLRDDDAVEVLKIHPVALKIHPVALKIHSSTNGTRAALTPSASTTTTPSSGFDSIHLRDDDAVEVLKIHPVALKIHPVALKIHSSTNGTRAASTPSASATTTPLRCLPPPRHRTDQSDEGRGYIYLQDYLANRRPPSRGPPALLGRLRMPRSPPTRPLLAPFSSPTHPQWAVPQCTPVPRAGLGLVQGI
eukprot:707277-Pyramimonas_sp.AAC.1